jgi:hypothetical protein
MNGDQMRHASAILALALYVLCFAIACWDIWVTMNGRSQDTVSTIVTEWSTRYPMLTLTIGIIIGHVFWK